MLKIDEDAVPFVLELLKECWNVNLFNPDTFATFIEDCLHSFRSKVGKVAYLFDLCLDSDRFACVFEVNSISG